MISSRIILASASPRRAQLLREAGVEFEVLPGHAPEAEPEHLTPAEAALLNAHRKARVIAKRCPDALVIGADTVVALGAQTFGKPADLAAAARTLAALQGRTHEVTTGVCLVHLRAHRERLLAVTTRVTFKALSPAQIARYHARMNPLDKAGAYAIQERGAEIIAGIEGSYTNVVGLPVEALLQALAEWAGMRR